MAVEKLKFEIGSSFSGQGFNDVESTLKKTNQQIEAHNKTLGAATRGIGEIADAFGDVAPEAAKATSSVGSFIQGFATGGIVGGTLSAAVGYFTDKIKEVNREAQEFADRMESFPHLFADDVNDALDETNSRFASMVGYFQQLSNEARDLLNVFNGNVAAEAQNKIFEVRMALMQKLDTALTDAEKAIARAAAAREISLIKATEAEKQATNRIKALERQIQLQTDLQERINRRKSEAERQIQDVEEVYFTIIMERNRMEERLTEIAAWRNMVAEDEVDELAQLMAEEMEIRKKLKEHKEKHSKTYEMLDKAERALAEAEKEEEKVTRGLTASRRALVAAQNAETKAIQDSTIATKEADLKLKEAKEAAAKALREAEEEKAAAAKKEKVQEEKEKKEKKDKAAASAAAETKVEVNVKIDKVKIDEKQVQTFGEWQAERRREARDQRYSFNEFKARFGDDFDRYVQTLSQPKAWLSDRDKELQAYMEGKLLKEMDSNMAARLFKDSAKRILMPKDLQEFLGDQSAIVKVLEKMKAR